MKPERLGQIRVLYVDHVPRLSGAEQSLADLVAGLGAGPVEPVVVLPEDGPLAAHLRAQGVLVRMVPMSRRMLETSRQTLAARPFVALLRLGAFLVAGLRLWRVIREMRPTLVHTNTLKSHLIAILPCKLSRTPLVWHLRDILPDGWLRRAFLACGRFPQAIVVPSRAVAEPFRGRRRVYAKLRLIPNGIRVADFQDARGDRSLRDMMGVAPGDPVIGIVGRIAPWKGQDVFLRAATMLARRHPRAHFAIVGAVLFPENDVPFEQELHRAVAQLGLEGRVTFCGWQPAPEAMAAIDVLVHASLEPEPFGRTIVEAMAAGKPVVAADGGAVREILPPSSGFVVPPGRPELLADAVDRLLSDRRLRKRMGEAGAAVADSFFPVARTVQSVALLYRSLATTRARRDRGRGRAPVPKPAQQPLAWPRTAPTTEAPPKAPPPRRHAPHQPVVRPPSRVVLPEAEPFEPVLPAAAFLEERGRDVVLTRTVRPLSGAQPAAAVLTPPPRMLPVAAPLPADVFAPRRAYDVGKLVLDILVASAILVLGSPVWLLVAVAIKLESRGPVLYRGTVHGRGCKPFTYYKFRSMRVDGSDKAHRHFIRRYVRENGAHEVEGRPVYKLIGDDRVTSVGSLIRKLSIDEIPQLWNVLRGEMSIVGPRPPLDYEYELYDDRAKVRLSVLPGITGLQQVQARHEASFDDKLRMDLEYVARRSIRRDVAIMLRTIPAALRGH